MAPQVHTTFQEQAILLVFCSHLKAEDGAWVLMSKVPFVTAHKDQRHGWEVHQSILKQFLTQETSCPNILTITSETGKKFT